MAKLLISLQIKFIFTFQIYLCDNFLMRSQQFLSRVAELSLQRSTDRKIAPYFPSSEAVVKNMLEFANITDEDIVYDVGSGDGRILIQACKMGVKKAVGVEIEPSLVKTSRENIKNDDNSRDKAFVIEDDFSNIDFSEATVITVYMGPAGTNDTQKYLTKLDPSVRIISHEYPFKNWNYQETISNVHDEPSAEGATCHHSSSYTLYKYSTRDILGQL